NRARARSFIGVAFVNPLDKCRNRDWMLGGRRPSTRGSVFTGENCRSDANWSSIADMNATLIDYVKLLPVYLLFVGTFGSASSEKFLSGGVPGWFLSQFEKTKLNMFPGSLQVQYYLIALMEAAVVLVFLLSAGSLEFLPGHDKSLLKMALVLA